MIIVFFGPPGSGKGTQSALLSKSLSIPSISTGDVFRSEISLKTDLGKLAESYVASGNLVPDEVVVKMVASRLLSEEYSNGFIADGFPRNLSQATSFEKILKEMKKDISIVFNLEVPDDVIIKRLSGRRICKNCKSVYNIYYSAPKKQDVCDNCSQSPLEARADDNEVVVMNRLKEYHKISSPVLDFYQKNNLLYSINGLASTSSISSKILEASLEVDKHAFANADKA